MKQVGVRDYSSQECLFLLLGFNLFSSSRKFVNLFLSNDNFIPILENSENDQRNQVEVYANRLNQFIPANRPGHQSMETNNQHIQNELEAVAQSSLYEFFSLYFKRTNNSTTWSKHREKRIVRVFPKLKYKINQNNDEFFIQQLKLHVPWSGNFEDNINPHALSWTEVYNQYSEIIPNFISFDDIEVESDEEGQNENQNNHDMDIEDHQIYMRMLPDSGQRLEAAELGLREQDRIDWTRSFSNYNINDCTTFIQTHNTTNLEKTYEPPMNVNFSRKQESVLNVLRSQIRFIQSGHQDEQFRKSLIIQGKAGSGKSLLINAFRSMLTSTFGADSFIIMAPTGSAANNIGAKTIHNGLKINIERKLSSLNPHALNELQENFKNCRFIIIDEMSLVGCSLLRKIDIRSRFAKNNQREPFGGMFLYLFGDLKQLPPVFDRAFYGRGFDNQYTNLGQDLFRQIEASIILTQSFRQQEEEQTLRNILDELADGRLQRSSWQILNQRALQNLTADEQQQFNNSLTLCDTTERTNQINYNRMREFQSVYKINSINSSISASHVPSRQAGNLEKVLYLAIGCRVMLRKNIWVEAGLVNGALRTVSDIVVQPDGLDMPLFVMVRFDNYRGPSINGAVPIVPSQSSWMSKNEECTRIQIPLCIAYAVTIHKSQGMTLDRALVCLGDSEWQLGLSYVGLSRVRTFNGLALDKEHDYQRFSRISNSVLFSLRQEEEQRLRTISLNL